jgi:hypothetical protein
MNEKPGLEPGFFCSPNCWRPDGLRAASGAEHMLSSDPTSGWILYEGDNCSMQLRRRVQTN